MMAGPFDVALDILTGGPQKRARIARDQKAAAEAARDAAIAQARSATEIALIEAQQQRELLVTVGIVGVVGLGAVLIFAGRRR